MKNKINYILSVFGPFIAGSIGCNLVSVGRSYGWYWLLGEREGGGRKGERVAQLSVGWVSREKG